MSDRAIETIWPRDYEAEPLPGLPGSGPEPLEFRATTHGRGREGLVVQVRHGTERWIGNFQRGDGTLSRIYPTPSPNHLCVVAGGRAYWVPVLAPTRYGVVEAYPVQDVRAISDLRLLVFVDFTNLVAYGQDGLRWISQRVSWDGITILRADSGGISGRGWDATQEQEVGFFVDAETGRTEGGAAPPGE